jgi:predicted secreted protein
MNKLSKTTSVLLIGLLSFTLIASYAAAASTGVWTFGGAAYEAVINNIEAPDGGHIIVGTTEASNNNYDAWMFKVDSDGNTVWSRPYDGGKNESAFNVISTSDGGYAIVGATTSYGADETGKTDLWLIKTDSEGNMQWNKTYGVNYYDEGWMILEVDDGYIIVGITYSAEEIGDGWLLKTDKEGNLLWNKIYGGSGDDGLYGVTKTVAGGYILAGYTNSSGAGGYDVWLIRVDEMGNQQWAQTYGGVEDDFGYIAFESETDFVVDGTTYSYGAGDADVWLLRVDAMGSLMWNYTYGGPDGDHGWYGAKTSDGYALCGFTYSYNTEDRAEAWLVKVDEHGMTLWNKTYGVSGKDYYAWAVIQTKEGGYALSGEVSPIDSEVSDAFLIVTDSDGNAVVENAPLTGDLTIHIVGAVIAVIIVIVVVVLLMKRKK